MSDNPHIFAPSAKATASQPGAAKTASTGTTKSSAKSGRSRSREFALQGLYWYYPLSIRNMVKANETDAKIEEVSYNVEKHFAKQESLISRFLPCIYMILLLLILGILQRIPLYMG
jgi:hypothetical protein